MAYLEHMNVTVRDPKATAAMLVAVFDWRIRWEGAGMTSGYTVHVGSDSSYLALFSFGDPALDSAVESYNRVAGLNHIGVVVDDLDATEARVKAQGFKTHSHQDYEPGLRFYFEDADGIDFEVVAYG